jgi:hypothetical protein
MNKRIKVIDLIIYFAIIIGGITLLVTSAINSSQKNRADSSQHVDENETADEEIKKE